MNQRKNYHGTITAVFNATNGEGDPTTLRYDAVVDESAGADSARVNAALQNHLPIRRVSANAILVAAQPGDPCTIAVRGDKVFLYAYTESITFQEACP
jgi:hypothetical protein